MYVRLGPLGRGHPSMRHSKLHTAGNVAGILRTGRRSALLLLAANSRHKPGDLQVLAYVRTYEVDASITRGGIHTGPISIRRS
jgi:hypothetical protein